MFGFLFTILAQMLKFQVTAAPSSSRCSPSSRSSCSSSSQRHSHYFSSSCSSAVGEQCVDRSIDELEEYVVHQPPDAPPFRDDTNQDECPATSARFCRRFPSPSPSLPDMSLSPASSSISSLNSTMDRSSKPVLPTPPIPPKPKRMAGEWGYLRVYTGQIKTDTDYKTLRVPSSASTECVIRQLVLDKLRLSLRDLNLFHLFMEVRTRRMDGTEARSILELDRTAPPLELQKCHPVGMSRFILGMDSNAILARVYDGEVNPESNYKSVLISRRTRCAEVVQMLCQMCRLETDHRHRPPPSPRDVRPSSKVHHQLGLEAISELRLFVDGPRGAEAALIPAKCPLAGVYVALLPAQRIVLRRVIVPRNGGILLDRTDEMGRQKLRNFE
uniref:Ras-associating domain-containing protein n=1 Tax=Globodera pallida TaxID=36090 RepID=A0A183C666_GLOPA